MRFIVSFKEKSLNVDLPYISEQKILTVEDLRRNFLSKKTCFHFHDYPIIHLWWKPKIYIDTQEKCT